MRGDVRPRRCLVGMAAAAYLLGAAGASSAWEPFEAGTKALALAAGYSLSHNELVGNKATLEGLHLIPHVGYFLTDEAGPGWARGNLELLAEPTLLYLEGRESATLGGLAVLGRWVFVGGARVRPYVEAGAGVLGGHLQLRRTGCDTAFIFQAGVGTLLFVSEHTAVTAGYRFHHLSNGNLCSGNPGLDSSLFVLGLSHFFR